MRAFLTLCLLAFVAGFYVMPSIASDAGGSGATMSRTTWTTIIPNDESETCTIRNLSQWINIHNSADILDGFQITKDVANGEVDITGGHAVLRNSETCCDSSELKVYHLDGVSDVAIPDLTSTYFYVDWNGGSPQITFTDDPSSINNTTEVAFGWAFRNGTSYIDVFQAGPTTSDFVSRWVTRAFDVEPVQRISGAQLSAPGTFHIAATAGQFYSVLSPAVTEQIDTSVPTGSFTAYYRSGPSTWSRTDSQLTVDGSKYNDLDTNTLANISPSWRYAIGWWYVIFDNPSRLAFVYGQDVYNNRWSAQNAARLQPTIKPPELSAPAVSKYLGSVIWRANESDFRDVLNVIDESVAQFKTADHNDLPGLQGGGVDQFYHLTLQQFRYLSGQESGEILNNQVSAVDFDSLLIDPAVYRGFHMSGSLAIDATTDVFRSMEVWAIWDGSAWTVTQESKEGADVVTFSVAASGQVQYTSNDFAGYTSGKFSYTVQPFAL